MRFLSWAELELVSKQLKLWLLEMNLDTKLIDSKAKLGLELGTSVLTVDTSWRWLSEINRDIELIDSEA